MARSGGFSEIVVARSGGFRGVYFPHIKSVDRVEFEMAVLKQRKIDGKHRVFQDKWTHQCFFITQKRKSCVFSLFGNNIEYSFSGLSREGHEVSTITRTQSQSLNAAASQLDIFQFAANPN